MFVVMSSGNPGGVPIDASTWAAGFMPSHYQGVQFRSGQEPVPAHREPRRSHEERSSRDARHDWEAGAAAARHHQRSGDPSKISQHEMAYRMQTSRLTSRTLSKEPDHVLDMHGPDVRKPGTFARNCLLARRLAERDVRYTMIVHMGWGPSRRHRRAAAGRVAGGGSTVSGVLVSDLKQRGLLDDTLVVFGTEFGRTSFAQGTLKTNFGAITTVATSCVWLAGGGESGARPRRDRRVRLQHRQGPGAHPRSQCHHPPPGGHRSRAARLPLPGARVPADGRRREGGEGNLA